MNSQSVRISEEGQRILNNKELANQLVEAITTSHKDLIKGQEVKVNGSGLSVILTSALSDEEVQAKSANSK